MPSERRPDLPAAIERAVRVEAGHRCSIPTCRATTTQIAHIDPRAETQDDSFENLILLCSNCHDRYDKKKEIDRLSIRAYKHNLGILNNRYGDFERRTFRSLAESGGRLVVLGPGGEIFLANAIKDGFFKENKIEGMTYDLSITTEQGENILFRVPIITGYWLTDLGAEFIKKYTEGRDLE